MGRYGLDRWDVDSLAFHAPVAMHETLPFTARLPFS
jgi:hypothetical protein